MSKGITEIDTYEFKLGEDLRAIAETELRETASARDFALNALREWIKMNPRIISVRLGNENNLKNRDLHTTVNGDWEHVLDVIFKILSNSSFFILLLNHVSFPDSNFLLRFLRAKKFSVPITQEAIERYLLLRHSYEPIFTNLDMTLPNMKTLINLGWVTSARKMTNARHLTIVRIFEYASSGSICRFLFYSIYSHFAINYWAIVFDKRVYTHLVVFGYAR